MAFRAHRTSFTPLPFLLGALVAIAPLWGCSDDDGPTRPPDSSVPDTQQQDMEPVGDGTPADTATSDTAPAEDTLAADTTPVTDSTADTTPAGDSTVDSTADLGACAAHIIEAEDTTQVTQSAGHWTVTQDAALHDGAGLSAGFANPNGTLTFSFKGTGLSVYHTKDAGWNGFGVSIDGGMTRLIFSSAASTLHQQEAEIVTGLTYGWHTVLLTDSSSASGEQNLIDYFQIVCD